MNSGKYVSPWLILDHMPGKCLLNGKQIIMISYRIEGWGNSPSNKYWVRFKRYDVLGALPYFSDDFSSLDVANDAADRYLVMNGFTFLTEEQWDKYKLLV